MLPSPHWLLNSDLHLACVWNCLCWHNAVDSRVESIQLLFSLGCLALYHEKTDARNSSTRLPTRYSTNTLRASSTSAAQVEILQVSSCLALVGADHPSDGRRSSVAQGLAACAAAARSGRWQWWSSAVAAADSWTLKNLLGPRGRGLVVKGDSFLKCMARAGRRAGIAPSDSKHTI